MLLNDSEIKKLLEEAEVVAVYGCSTNPSKPSHEVPEFLQNKGYKIIPMNPKAENILGEKVIRQLKDLPKDVDIIDVFRPSEEAKEVVREIVSLGLKPKAIWLQLGIKHPEAEKLANDANIPIIMDKCMKIEYNKHFTK